jgi:Domain of unknown function (DUF5122) beta-propeller
MQRGRRFAIVGGLATTAILALASVPAAADTATLFSPNPADGWGQDGTAYAVAITGDTVFAGGSFLNAVHNPQAPVGRTNLMAVQRSNPLNLLPFAPTTDGTVRAMATDGTALYIGGDFTMVNNTPRNHLAKLDLAGNLDMGWSVDVPKAVRDLLVVGNKLYLVGDFGTVNGTVRKRAAAVDKGGTGQLDGSFNPNLGGKAYAVAAFGSTVYLGGNFLTVGGASRPYLAAVDATSGALQDPVFKNVGDVILDLSVNTDTGKQVFGAGGGGFNSAAAWNTDPASPDFGKRQWVQRANGDVQAVRFAHKTGTSGVGNVYFGFHDGFLGNVKLRLLAADATNGTLMWAQGQPVSGGNPGVVALDTDNSYLVVAGRFPKMGTVKVRGLSIHS